MDALVSKALSKHHVEQERVLEAEVYGDVSSEVNVTAEIPAVPAEFDCRFCNLRFNEVPSSFCLKCKGSLFEDGWLCALCTNYHLSGVGHGSDIFVVPQSESLEEDRPEGATPISVTPLSRVGGLVFGGGQTPSFGRGGQLYIPHGHRITCIDAYSGRQLQQLNPETLGMAPYTFTSALDPLSHSILLSSSARGGIDVTALNIDSLNVRWRTESKNFTSGIAVLGVQAIAIAANQHDNALYTHRLDDGECIGCVPGVPGPSFLASDPRTATVYVSVFDGLNGGVHAYRWTGDAGLAPHGSAMEGIAAAVPATRQRRPVAVMAMAAPAGGSHAFLIVGSHRSPFLHILALPSHRLLAVLELPGLKIVGLAADAGSTGSFHGPRSGGGISASSPYASNPPCLAVMDAASGDAIVLPWPLPGMPSLV